MMWASGGIGRRAGFRFQCPRTSGFESREAHHGFISLAGAKMNKYFDRSDILFFKITAGTALIAVIAGFTFGIL